MPRCLYELWVHAEAQLDVYKALHVDGRASEAELRMYMPRLVQLVRHAGMILLCLTEMISILMMQTNSPPNLGMKTCMPPGMMCSICFVLTFCFAIFVRASLSPL